jgi:hypothetical protein
MRYRLGLLIGGTLAAWVLLVYPAMRVLGEQALLRSAAALLICLIPAAGTLAFALRGQVQRGEDQLLAMLGGMGVRMAFVLGLGFLAYSMVPVLHADEFWIWLIVFYLLTLGLEIGLVVKAQSVPH